MTPEDVPAFHKIRWSDDRSIAAFVEDAWAHRSEEQRQAEMLGEMCAAWYSGQQYLFPTSIGGYQLALLPNPYDRLRLVFNLFGPHLDQYIAKVAIDPLEPEAVPASGSLPDIDAARLQTPVCRYYRDKLDLTFLKDALVGLIAMEGMGFTKVTWDPLAGSDFSVSRDDARRLELSDDVIDELFPADAEADGAEARLNLGEIDAENVSLRNLTWGPIGVPFKQAEWILEAHERSIGYAMERWGLKEKDIAAAYPGARERWYRGVFDQHGSIKEENRNDVVVVYELWCPRSATNPRGRFAVVIGDKVVNRRHNRKLENPYDHGRTPYIECMALKVPGRAIGKTPAWDCFDPQAMINKLASQIMENIELFANPRVWVREDEAIDEWELTSKPGGIHRYSTHMPEIMPGVTMPSTVYAIFDRWIRVLQEAIGVHDVSIGRAPQSGRSGRFILALQDADNTRMAPTTKRVTRWGQDLFRLILTVARQFITDERLIAIRGADNAWEWRSFRGEQLLPGGSPSSGPEAFNIQLRTTGQARSRAAQIELATMLIQYGFFRPDVPEDRRMVMLMLELGDTTQHMDAQQAHRDLQRRVHEKLLHGVWIPPAYYHHHAVRLEELRRFQNSPDFEGQPPEIKELFKRYEFETIGLQAVRELEVQAITQQAVHDWQQRRAAEKTNQLFGRLQASAPQESDRIARLLAGPQGAALRQFFQAA